MALLYDLHDIVTAERDSTFDYDRWQDKVMTNFKELCFLGQIDKDSLYVSMLHQIIDPESGGAGKIHDLTFDEMNEFYLTGAVRYPGYHPYAWTFWFINLEKEYVKVFTSFHGDKRKSPKDNYGIAYEHDQTKQWIQGTNKVTMHEFLIKDSPYKEIFDKLLDIIRYSKNHEIDFADFDKKIYQDMRQYFGMIDGVKVDDVYKETMRPELIRTPVKHDPVHIRTEIQLLELIKGDRKSVV
jgi:hypothetical protein